MSNQLRTGRTSWTQVHPTLSGKVRSKVVFVEEAKRLNYAGKHRKWGAEKWQQVLWTDESEFEIFGFSRRQVARFNNESLQATDGDVPRYETAVMDFPWKLGLHFCKQSWRFGLALKVSSMMRNTGRYLSIMQYHQEGVWLVANLFCIRTIKPRWLCGLCRSLISISSVHLAQKDFRKPTSTEDLWLVLQAVYLWRLDADVKLKGGRTKDWLLFIQCVSFIY